MVGTSFGIEGLVIQLVSALHVVAGGSGGVGEGHPTKVIKRNRELNRIVASQSFSPYEVHRMFIGSYADCNPLVLKGGSPPERGCVPIG